MPDSQPFQEHLMTRNLVLAGLVALILQVTSAQAGDPTDGGTFIPFAGPYTPHFPPYNDPYSAYGYYGRYHPSDGGLYGTPTAVNGASPAVNVQPPQVYGQIFPFQMYGQTFPFQTYGQPAFGQVYGRAVASSPAPLPSGNPAPRNQAVSNK
jgi:hypothetical protein